LTNRALDNGLSAKGKKQARRVARYYKERFGGGPAPRFFSSPKRRCLETLAPLAKFVKRPVHSDAALLEQGPAEGRERFVKRIESFLGPWRGRRRALAVFCSHGDWIPEAIRLLTGAPVILKKGGWAEVKWGADGVPRLRRVLQKLP
jgi:8-oxo-dGTP diphosphatase